MIISGMTSHPDGNDLTNAVPNIFSRVYDISGGKMCAGEWSSHSGDTKDLTKFSPEKMDVILEGIPTNAIIHLDFEAVWGEDDSDGDGWDNSIHGEDVHPVLSPKAYSDLLLDAVTYTKSARPDVRVIIWDFVKYWDKTKYTESDIELGWSALAPVHAQLDYYCIAAYPMGDPWRWWVLLQQQYNKYKEYGDGKQIWLLYAAGADYQTRKLHLDLAKGLGIERTVVWTSHSGGGYVGTEFLNQLIILNLEGYAEAWDVPIADVVAWYWASMP